MISLSFKENKSDKHLVLQDVKNLKLALHNRNSNTKDVFSDGWSNYLREAGNKYILLKVNGISCGSDAEHLLREYAFSNDLIECTLSLSDYSKEAIHTMCFVALYEKFYEAGSLDIFNVILLSSGKVHYSDDKR